MHYSVLKKEVIMYMHIENRHLYIDATLGAGGHSVEIVKQGGIVLGIDADTEMLKIARKRLEEACPSPDTVGGCFKLVQGNFSNITSIATQNGFAQVDGILFDLGVSLFHYKENKRGFTFSDPEQELDMRLDPSTQAVKAADLLNVLRGDQLAEIFSRSQVASILKFRESSKFEKVGDLLSLLPSKRPGDRIHPATEIFMRLRIAVNNEFENISKAIPEALNLVKKSGRILVLTFHSDEDRLVKNLFNSLEKEGVAKIITNEPILPSLEEKEENPSSRSAKLRILEKI